MSEYPPVPYVAQRGNTPANDCGLACVMMMGQWPGRTFALTLSQLAAKYDPQDDGTTSSQLATALRNEVALTPIISNTQAYPFINLVNYASLPIENRSDKTGNTFLHWIVRLGDTLYHDPYWWDSTGANLTATKAQLDAASRASSTNPNIGIQERPQPMATGAFARAAYGRKYLIPWTGDARWPQYPPCTTAQHDALEARRRTSGFTLGNSHDDAGLAVITTDGTRGQEVVELWGWPQEARATYNSFYTQYYPHAKIEYHEWAELNPKPPEPQPPASHPAFENISRAQALTGMHTINWVEDARAAVDKGCRVITMLDNLSGAREIRDRGVVVIYRTWFNDGGWTPMDCFNRLGVNADDRLILVGQNECDAGRCPGDIANLQERFRWDKEFAEICWQRAPKCFPAIGGFSVGTPPIDNPDFARAFRDTYAAFLNANYQKVGLNWHLYVWRRVTESWKPSGEEVHPDQRWWAGRAKIFGYDPAYGGLNSNVISVSDEIGGECGHGGWNWAGYNDGDATQWWNYWRDYVGAFSQLKYATVFIGCRSESWRGYDVRYLWDGSFRSIWSQSTASATASAMSAQAAQIDDYESGEKDAIGRAMFEARMKQAQEQDE